MKCIVFDLGGTLFEFIGMPYSWVDYYEKGLRHVSAKYGLNCTEEEIKLSDSILKRYNPRINYREKEITPSEIFDKATKHWKKRIPVKLIIDEFFKALNLNARVYEDVPECLRWIKDQNDKIAFFTDLPSGMPEKIIKNEIRSIMPFADVYMSSLQCGYRKPNPKGLLDISEQLNYNINELIFIGDEEKDLKTAARARCRFIMIDRKKERSQITNMAEVIEKIYYNKYNK